MIETIEGNTLVISGTMPGLPLFREHPEGITRLEFRNCVFTNSGPICINDIFRDWKELKEVVGYDELIIPHVYSADSIFEGCTNLERVDLRKLKIPGLYSAQSAFKDCINLKEVFLDEFEVDEYTECIAAHVFENCPKLEFIFAPCVKFDYLIYSDRISFEYKNYHDPYDGFKGCDYINKHYGDYSGAEMMFYMLKDRGFKIRDNS